MNLSIGERANCSRRASAFLSATTNRTPVRCAARMAPEKSRLLEPQARTKGFERRMAHEQGHGGVSGRGVRGFRHGRGPRQGSRVERARLHGSAHSDGLAGSQASLVKRPRRDRPGLTLDRRKKRLVRRAKPVLRVILITLLPTDASVVPVAPLALRPVRTPGVRRRSPDWRG